MPARLALSGGPAWALVGAAGVGILGGVVMAWQLLAKTEALGECRGDKTSHIETSEINAASVETIRDRLAVCLKEQGDDLRSQAEATRINQRQLRELTEAVTAARAQRDRANELDECAAYRACVVCDPIADSLRDSAARAARDDG